MRAYFLLRDIFSLLNIGLILYLLRAGRKSEETTEKWNARKIVCLFLLMILRIIENRIQIHVFYVYWSIAVIFLVLGHVFEKRAAMYNLLVSGIFLSFISLSWVIAGIVGYIWTKGSTASFLLPANGQIGLMVIAELSMIAGVFLSTRIVKKIPFHILRLNFFTIMIPLLINIMTMAVVGDHLYYNTDMLDSQILSVVTTFFMCIILMIGSFCNIAVLEYYLNVKEIESEKNLQISEMSLQYDYYIRLERESEKVRRLAHDIRNHLEAIKGSDDDSEKQEYIRSIESQLEGYESYCRTGNTFIDSLLQSKAQEAAEAGIEFKVTADFKPFENMKNEDLCIMVANSVDNALRECRLKREEEPEGECIVQLRAGKIRNFLSIVCENSIRERQAEMVRNGEELKTTKEDRESHGYGMKNMESVVCKYGGEMSIAVHGNLFCISMIIPV